ncbi:4523_t:CDS:1, partial [Cetraspora pellucida]
DLPDELLIKIIKRIVILNHMIIVCKRFYTIISDHQFKADWIIFRFGKTHALFYAVNLGPSFINIKVVEAIICKGGNFSRYFIQRLHTVVGFFDKDLLKHKIRHRTAANTAEEELNLFQFQW